MPSQHVNLQLPIRLLSFVFSIAVGLLNQSVCWSQAQTQQPLTIKVLSYNIHHGQGVDGKQDIERIAAVIRGSGADIVSLQEVDLSVQRSGRVEQPQALAKSLGMHVAFGGNIELQGGQYGNAVLSRFPIQSSTNHMLPNTNGGEQRGLLHAQIELPAGPPMNFLATHLDHRPDPAQRLDSARFINDLALSFDPQQPTWLAGDLNATPDSQVLELLRQRFFQPQPGEFATIPVEQPQRQIDYILIKHLPLTLKVLARSIRTEVLDVAIASDHRGILTEIELSPIGDSQVISRIAFGSCIQHDQPLPIFDRLLEDRPELLLFLGDNIYADTDDLAVLRAKYQMLGSKPEFRRLTAASRVLATWDDHDFGRNDGGADFAFRQASQAAFFDFWDEPKDSSRRTSPGIFQAQVFGPPEKRLQVIMLDTRYFRSPLKTAERRTGGPYVPDSDPQKTLLGPDQWTWLEEQLRQPAKVRLLVSSIQCLPSDAGQETWSNLPLERQRLLDLLESTHADNMLLLSGDRHWSELSILDRPAAAPLYELTSSSFNQLHPRGSPTENRFRALDKTYHQPNYGLIEIDWSTSVPRLLLQIRDIRGQIQLEKPIAF